MSGGDCIYAELEYLSDVGLLLRATDPLDLPSALTLRFEVLGGPCEATGQLVRLERTRARVAIRFDDTNELLGQLTRDLSVLRAADRVDLLAAIMNPAIHVDARSTAHAAV